MRFSPSLDRIFKVFDIKESMALRLGIITDCPTFLIIKKGRSRSSVDS